MNNSPHSSKLTTSQMSPKLDYVAGALHIIEHSKQNDIWSERRRENCEHSTLTGIEVL